MADQSSAACIILVQSVAFSLKLMVHFLRPFRRFTSKDSFEKISTARTSRKIAFENPPCGVKARRGNEGFGRSGIGTEL